MPQLLSGTLGYSPGTQVCYYLSDINGALATTGSKTLWRATLPLGQVNWIPDTT